MTLLVEKRGAVGWIVFNQPEKRNAINGAMWRGIPQAMRQFDADAEVRCVAFRGAGTAALSERTFSNSEMSAPAAKASLPAPR